MLFVNTDHMLLFISVVLTPMFITWQNDRILQLSPMANFLNFLMNIFEKFTYNMYWSVLNINLIKKKIWQPVDFLGIVFPIFRVTKQTIDDINRLLYSIMYNMEIYCMSLYCIENPYWTRICIVLKTRIGQDARPIRVFNGPHIYPRIPQNTQEYPHITQDYPQRTCEYPWKTEKQI
jgi:hypothetical protein